MIDTCYNMYAYVLGHFSHVWLFATLWTVAHQSPLSMGFFRQESWSGLPCPPPGNLPNPGIKPASLTLADRFFTAGATWKACCDMDQFSSVVQSISSVTQVCPTLCNPMDCSTPGLPVHHHLPELAQTHVHWVSDAIQPSHPLSSPSPPAPNPSQHQGLFQWVSSLYQVAKGLELQLQHQSFQWIFRTDFL